MGFLQETKTHFWSKNGADFPMESTPWVCLKMCHLQNGNDNRKHDEIIKASSKLYEIM